jgi:hypothetical protein
MAGERGGNVSSVVSITLCAVQAFRWMNCLLMRELPLGGIIRLWDTYLSEADGFGVLHLYTSAALLSTLSPQIQAQADFAETFTFLLNPPTISACCYLLFLCAFSTDEHVPPMCMFRPWASVWYECPLQPGLWYSCSNLAFSTCCPWFDFDFQNGALGILLCCSPTLTD